MGFADLSVLSTASCSLWELTAVKYFFIPDTSALHQIPEITEQPWRAGCRHRAHRAGSHSFGALTLLGEGDL